MPLLAAYIKTFDDYNRVPYMTVNIAMNKIDI